MQVGDKVKVYRSFYGPVYRHCESKEVTVLELNPEGDFLLPMVRVEYADGKVRVIGIHQCREE